jgi:hypothetical protein
MREIRTSGSEGGGTGTTGPPYPYIPTAPAGLKGETIPHPRGLQMV